MIIAISLVKLPFSKPATEPNHFYTGAFTRMALAAPQHQFVFITTDNNNEIQTLSTNTLTVISQPKSDTILFWKFWLDHTLPAILKKHKADLLINLEEITSLRTNVPQLTFFKSLFSPMPDEFYAKRKYRFMKTYTAAFLQRSSIIIANSFWLKNKMISGFKIDDRNIEVLYPGFDALYQPIPWNEKEILKQKYAEGKEYFLNNGSMGNKTQLLDLLKAFSVFKKRQKSNMQLIMVMPSPTEKNKVPENLKTYKYRTEVKIITGLSNKEMAQLTAAAYAFVQPAADEQFPVASLSAMQCEVPVITAKNNTAYEIFGDSALYTEAGNFDDIADKMMLVFKDENLRNDLIKKGKLCTTGYSITKADRLLEQYITKWIAGIPANNTLVGQNFKK